MQHRPLTFYVCVLAAVALTIGAGLVQGHLRQRWGGPEDKAAIVARLTDVPAEFGAWRKVESRELGEFARNTLQCYGHLGRVYRNVQTGAIVSLSLIAGPPGPTSVHTPEICMGSQEYHAEQPRQELSLPNREDVFWNVTFHTTNVEQQHVRVAYAWRFDGPWTAAEQPRLLFGWRPYLYKLQVSCVGDKESTRASCQDFLTELLSALDNAPQ
jgi:hypothetical protein